MWELDHGYRKFWAQRSRLERAFLGKGIAGQGRAFRTFRDFDAHGRSIGRGDACRTKHGELAEDFVVNLGDQIILAIGVTAPDLPELNGTYGHSRFPEFMRFIPHYRGAWWESMARMGTGVSAKMLPSVPPD